ncbi:MAG: hypothetical protein V3V59_08870 [Thermodesulfovibrionales bacterium]
MSITLTMKYVDGSEVEISFELDEKLVRYLKVSIINLPACYCCSKGEYSCRK